jgi:hypothetical protein
MTVLTTEWYESPDSLFSQGKIVPVHPMKVNWGVMITPLIVNLNPRWGEWSASSPGPFMCEKGPVVCIEWKGGWVTQASLDTGEERSLVSLLATKP